MLGIVFLLGNLHMLSWLRLGTLFAHYWPALLILWGVIKLIEYQQAQRDGVPARGIGAGGVFLVIFIVVCGLIATQAARFNWGELRDNMNIDDGDLNNIFGETFNFDDHLEQDISARHHQPARQRRSRRGPRQPCQRQQNHRHRAQARGRGKPERRRQVQPGDEADDHRHRQPVDARRQNPSRRQSLRAERSRYLHPPQDGVQVTSRRGEVSVTGRDGEVEINNQHGDVSVEDVTGNVKLNLEKSSAKVEQITGDVHIDGRLNEVSVTDIKGAAQFDGEFQESVKLARISKSVAFKSSRTDLEFSRIDGDLDLDSDDLHADQITGPVHLTTRSKQIRLDDVSGDVRVQDENGGVEVSMRSLGNVQIDSRNGDIHLSVPDKAGFHVDARTRDGEIQSDFPELKIDNGDHEAKATGSVGNGASHIVLNNEHDGIEIRKASAKATLAAPATPANPGQARQISASTQIKSRTDGELRSWTPVAKRLSS